MIENSIIITILTIIAVIFMGTLALRGFWCWFFKLTAIYDKLSEISSKLGKMPEEGKEKTHSPLITAFDKTVDKLAKKITKNRGGK